MLIAAFRKGLFGLVILFTALNTAASTSVGCNDSYVSISDAKLRIEIAPTNDDDTENLQCALDTAVQLGVPIVRFGPADYYISNIIVENFNGTLQGRSRSTTRLLVKDFSIDCQGLVDQNRTSAALKFVKGRPRIHAMQIIANESCQDGQQLRSIVHFTGASASADNGESDVIFGAVDRVDIQAGSILETNPRTAVMVRSESGWFPEACSTDLLGAFSMRQSRVENTMFGVYTEMNGKAQVDISFNQFQSNLYGVVVRNAKQNTMIYRNEISTTVTGGNEAVGIFVLSNVADASAGNSVVVKQNQFELSVDLESESKGWAVVFALYNGAKPNISAVVSNNVFLMENATSIQGHEISKGHISENRIRVWGLWGATYPSIIINGDVRMASGWTISNNMGSVEGVISSMPLAPYIVFGERTKSNITGPGQNFAVGDFGVDNYIIHGPDFNAETQLLNEQSVSKLKLGGVVVRSPQEISP